MIKHLVDTYGSREKRVKQIVTRRTNISSRQRNPFFSAVSIMSRDKINLDILRYRYISRTAGFSAGWSTRGLSPSFPPSTRREHEHAMPDVKFAAGSLLSIVPVVVRPLCALNRYDICIQLRSDYRHRAAVTRRDTRRGPGRYRSCRSRDRYRVSAANFFPRGVGGGDGGGIAEPGDDIPTAADDVNDSATASSVRIINVVRTKLSARETRELYSVYKRGLKSIQRRLRFRRYGRANARRSLAFVF